jgi:hypothetical protein
MTSKPVVLQVRITELPSLVEQKSKQTALSDRPVSDVIINDLSLLIDDITIFLEILDYSSRILSSH